MKYRFRDVELEIRKLMIRRQDNNPSPRAGIICIAQGLGIIKAKPKG